MGKNMAVQEQIKIKHFETITKWWNNSLPVSNQTFWLLTIILGALAIRIWLVFTNGYGCRPDTFSFLTQAHDLVNGHWDRWFYINTKPPVYSFLLAGGIKSGLNEMVFSKCISIFMSIVFLHPAWLILGRLTKGPARVLALAVTAFCLIVVEISTRMTSDITYAVVLMYSLYFALYKGLLDQKTKGFIIGGVLLGIAFLTRSEAIIYLPLVTIFAVWGAIRNRIAWKTAAKSLLYPTIAVIVLAPQVTLLCRYEGRFLLRRNAGNLIAESINKAQINLPTVAESVSTKANDDTSKLRQLSTAVYRMIVTVAVNSSDYITDKIPTAVGYVPALFLIIGLIACGKKSFQFSPESITLLSFVWTLVVLSPIEAHSRFLIGVLPIIAAPIATGIIILSAKLLQNKPAEFSDKQLEKSSIRLVIIFFILGVIGPTAARVATRNPYDGTEIIATGKVFAEIIKNNPSDQSKIILTNVGESSRLKYITGMPMVLLHEKKAYTAQEIEDILIEHQATKFLVITERSRKSIFPDFPVLSKWAKHLETCQTHPKSKKPERVYIFQIYSEKLIDK
ncbi:MAG: glycosyltransferase family 39 protein [Phycisphaerae bacterium]|nr:glycosyltransferase family 39 protein [Phycisphaerae bacterium]